MNLSLCITIHGIEAMTINNNKKKNIHVYIYIKSSFSDLYKKHFHLIKWLQGKSGQQ